MIIFFVPTSLRRLSLPFGALLRTIERYRDSINFWIFSSVVTLLKLCFHHIFLISIILHAEHKFTGCIRCKELTTWILKYRTDMTLISAIVISFVFWSLSKISPCSFPSTTRGISPLRHFRNVDLPLPLLPVTKIISPGCSAKRIILNSFRTILIIGRKCSYPLRHTNP